MGHGVTVPQGAHEARDKATKQVDRIIRVHLKKIHDLKRELKRDEKPQQLRKAKPNQVILLGEIDNRNGATKHLVHGYTIEFGFDANLSAHQLREQLVRRVRLKWIKWLLELWNGGSVEHRWFDMSAVSNAKKGDRFRVAILGTKKRTPNSPGTSKRIRLERANQRAARLRGLKTFVSYGEQVQTQDVNVSVPGGRG
jgi:hypothetical protein